MGSGNLLLGVLAGAAAGALLGTLVVTYKGSKTRRQILSKGQADALKEKFDELADAITKRYEYTHEKAEALLSNGEMK